MVWPRHVRHPFDNISRAPMAFLFIFYSPFLCFWAVKTHWSVLARGLVASDRKCTLNAAHLCVASVVTVEWMPSESVAIASNLSRKRKRSNQIEISNELNINWHWHRARESWQRRRLCSSGAIYQHRKIECQESIRIFQKLVFRVRMSVVGCAIALLPFWLVHAFFLFSCLCRDSYFCLCFFFH